MAFSLSGIHQKLKHGKFQSKLENMRLLLILCLLSWVGTAINAQQTGIKFEKSNWETLLDEAESSGELIFVDAYTTWCGPCIMMSRDVFTDESVGRFYNQHFINAKIDMEAGEGIQLSRKYKVEAFPTLLFINGKGDVVHRATGYQDIDDFIALGKVAISPDQNLKAMNARYRKGDRAEDFMLQLILTKYNAMDGEHLAVAEEYLDGQEDWSTLPNMQLIYGLIVDPDSKWFEYMLSNRNAFETLFGKEQVAAKLQNLFLEKAFEKGKDALTEVDAFYEKAYPELAPKLSANFRMNYYRTAGDLEAFAKAAVDYLDNHPSDDPNELNNIAWEFFESITDKKLLGKALQWAERSVQLDKQYYNQDTLANLYYKLGKRSKAEKTALAAIELAKIEGVDYAVTQELLDKTKKRK